MTVESALADLGWTVDLEQQLALGEGPALSPARVTSVQRDAVVGQGALGTRALILPSDASAGEFAVGDWLLHDDQDRIVRRLDRRSLLQRRAAGTGREVQLIAANVDVLFIVTSCNDDFNLARLERYLVLAAEAGVDPVILLTKADTAADPDHYLAEARRIAGEVPVATINAKSPTATDLLAQWLTPGRTGALLGSSGVGKTTLMNALTGGDAATFDARAADARGRHTTTARGLFPTLGGAWIVDTPGMRAIRLSDVSDGIGAVFSDFVDLAAQCRFNDCAHDREPGCAVQAAIAAGAVDADRLERWRKLSREEAQNTASIQQSRRRDKGLNKMYREGKANRRRKEGI